MKNTRRVTRRVVRDARSQYFNYVVKYFNYRGGDFLSTADDIVVRAMYSEDEINEDNIYDIVAEAIDSGLIYYSNQWDVLEFYCSPTNANWDEAIESFENDIISIVEEILDDRDNKEDTEEE